MTRRRATHAERELAFEILRNILRFGLLCAPERFDLYPDPDTERGAKRALARDDAAHSSIDQARACFTVMDVAELSQAYRIRADDSVFHAHCDLFGEFAIGLDPIRARELGIVPAIYFYRSEHVDARRPSGRIAGLGSQIVHRLDELRNVMAILSRIESLAPSNSVEVPDAVMLKRMGISTEYEEAVDSILAECPVEFADAVFRLFDTDRIAAWNIADFVNLMLSLFQTTDSTLEDAPLAFFQQREWRLVHHMRRGMDWYGLGDHSELVDPHAAKFQRQRNAIRGFLETSRPFRDDAHKRWYFDHAWMLHGAGGLPFRSWISEIIVPPEYLALTQSLVGEAQFPGRKPSVRALLPRWRIEVRESTPVAVELDDPTPKSAT